MGALVFAGPTVNVCGLHRIPFSGALRVFEHRTADAVFPLLGGHEHNAGPRHILLTGVSHLLIGLDKAEEAPVETGTAEAETAAEAA